MLRYNLILERGEEHMSPFGRRQYTAPTFKVEMSGDLTESGIGAVELRKLADELDALEKSPPTPGFEFRRIVPHGGGDPKDCKECGGTCRLQAGHEGPCLCVGDVDGPDTCPA